MRRPFIVAEIGAAHNRSLERTLNMVDAAASAGADAVKIQCYTADTMVADLTLVLEDGPWAGRNLHQLYAQGSMPWHWIPDVFERAKRHGMVGFASPFDESAVRYLERIDCPMYKVASIEITDLSLIRRIARTRKPMIISTGMATEDEIAQALQAAFGVYAGLDITLLKCTSAYPSKIDDCNLATIEHMARRFNCAVGLSDHTAGSLAAVIATTAYQASVIEKHLTLSDDGGLDDHFATSPDSFCQFVNDIRCAVQAVGGVHYGPTRSEASSLVLRRSLYVVGTLRAGDVITLENVSARRPDRGLPPSALPEILGKRVNQDLEAGTPLQDFMIDGHELSMRVVSVKTERAQDQLDV